MSRVVELLSNLQKNSSLAGGFSSAVGNATKAFISGNTGGGTTGGNNQDASRLPSSTYHANNKPIEETLEAGDKGHPVSKDVAQVDETIKNQGKSMSKLAGLKELNARKGIRLAKYKEAGFGRVSKMVPKFVKNPAGGKGFKEGLKQGGRTALNVGVPVGALVATDKYVGSKLEDFPALRGLADITAAGAINPVVYRKLKAKQTAKNLDNLMAGSKDKSKYMDEYATKILKKNPVDMSPRDEALAVRYAREQLQGKAGQGAAFTALKDQAKAGVYASTLPLMAGGGMKFMDKTQQVADIMTAPVEAPKNDPVTGKALLDADGNPIMITKTRIGAIGDRFGSGADSFKTEAGKISGSLDKMTGEDNAMDKINDMAGTAKEYFDLFVEYGPAQLKEVVKVMDKHKIPLGAGAIGLGSVFLYAKWKKEQKEKKKKEEEEKIKRLQAKAYKKLAQMG